MRGVIFDLDETLVDRRGSLGIYCRKLYLDFGESVVLPASQFTAEFHRLDDNGRVPRDEFFKALSAAAFRNVPSALIKEHFEATAWVQPRLFDGIVDLLVSLRAQDLRIGVITNSGVPSQSAKLNNTGLSDLIDASVISAAFGSKKPAPGIFHHMIDGLRIDPHQSWFVGDDPRADVWGANQVGFRTCWVERYTPWPADLPRCYDVRIEHTIHCLGIVTSVV